MLSTQMNSRWASFNFDSFRSENIHLLRPHVWESLGDAAEAVLLLPHLIESKDAREFFFETKGITLFPDKIAFAAALERIRSSVFGTHAVSPSTPALAAPPVAGSFLTPASAHGSGNIIFQPLINVGTLTSGSTATSGGSTSHSSATPSQHLLPASLRVPSSGALQSGAIIQPRSTQSMTTCSCVDS